MYCSQKINGSIESYGELRKCSKNGHVLLDGMPGCGCDDNHIITLINMYKTTQPHFSLVVAIQLVESFYKI